MSYLLRLIDQSIPEAGRRLTEMLFDLIQGRPAEELQEVWQATLNVRESDGSLQR